MDVIVVGANGQGHVLAAATFRAELASGRLPPTTDASVDGGKTWQPAWQIDRRLHARGDDGVAAVVPTLVEGWSLAAGYVALFSLLFFAGPLVGGAAIVAFDHATPKDTKAIFVAVSFVLGPAPIALLGWLGLRGVAKDPVLRGRGRAVFALAVAGLLAAACFFSLVVALLV